MHLIYPLHQGGGLLSDNVQDAIEEVSLKQGGDINGHLNMSLPSETTANRDVALTLGNDIPVGQVGNSTGVLILYSRNGFPTTIWGQSTSSVGLALPDKGGYIATTGDVYASEFSIDEHSTGYKSDGYYFKLPFIKTDSYYWMSIGMSAGGGSLTFRPKVVIFWVQDKTNHTIESYELIDKSMPEYDIYNVTISWDSTENCYILYREHPNRLWIKRINGINL